MNATALAEPIAGYTLGERLGGGGYGEVWQAAAPGGLAKAIKFVYGFLEDDRAAQEMKALERVRDVRHPFLLSLERIEVVDGRLLIVTELADGSLRERFQECLSAGRPGIERRELLGYLRDAAEALDFMSDRHALQHLDVKPENLLLVGGRVKVGDFGLVKEIHGASVSLLGGLTPVYAAPEVFDGAPSRQSDQYSLAIVYQELATGELPFPGRTLAQLAAQHVNSSPRLGPLPPTDRAAVERALAKDPARRFGSCRAFIDELLEVERRTATQRAAPPAGERPAATGDTTPVATQVTAPLPRRPAVGPHHDPGPTPRAQVAVFRTEPLPEGPPSGGPPKARGVPVNERPWVPCAPPAAAAVVDLPPFEPAGQVDASRPALFVGLGGTGGRVLAALRARIAARSSPEGGPPPVRMLAIDTDLKALARLSQGEGPGRLEASETLGLPLRQPWEYRADSRRLLAGVSRRWIYNVPRALETEGLRPLGRLALVDHAASLRNALQAHVDGLATPSAETSPTDGRPRAARPRAFVVAAISRGTGSGMALDVGFALRGLFQAAGYAAGDVALVLLHATDRSAAHQEVAVANSLACLRELFHYSRQGRRFDGDPAIGIAPFESQHDPAAAVYCVDAGQALDDEGYAGALEGLAEWLWLASLSPAATFFDRCREPPARGKGPCVRTFGIGLLGDARPPALPWTGAAPRLAACGGTRRMLAVGPEAAFQAASAPGAAAATIVHDDRCGLVLCQELGDVPLETAAGTLAEGRPEAADIAARLHGRNDIDWSPWCG
jgi:hypothetical protein